MDFICYAGLCIDRLENEMIEFEGKMKNSMSREQEMLNKKIYKY